MSKLPIMLNSVPSRMLYFIVYDYCNKQSHFANSFVLLKNQTNCEVLCLNEYFNVTSNTLWRYRKQRLSQICTLRHILSLVSILVLRTGYDNGNNVCLDLHHWRYSIYVYSRPIYLDLIPFILVECSKLQKKHVHLEM
jgi:hypothetical protein